MEIKKEIFREYDIAFLKNRAYNSREYQGKFDKE